jgi:hypothetical protein
LPFSRCLFNCGAQDQTFSVLVTFISCRRRSEIQQIPGRLEVM